MIHSFYKGISPNVNIIERQKLELTFYDAAVQYAYHHATGSSRVQ